MRHPLIHHTHPCTRDGWSWVSYGFSPSNQKALNNSRSKCKFRGTTLSSDLRWNHSVSISCNLQKSIASPWQRISQMTGCHGEAIWSSTVFKAFLTPWPVGESLGWKVGRFKCGNGEKECLGSGAPVLSIYLTASTSTPRTYSCPVTGHPYGAATGLVRGCESHRHCLWVAYQTPGE